MKTALITGVTGQDGSYLSEFLLEKGYDVHGTIRRSSVDFRERIAHLEGHPHFHLHYADLGDSMSVMHVVSKVRPDEIYNLAAQSHVQVSFDSPEYTANVDATGVLRILEAVRLSGLVEKTRIYQASTSELYGKVEEVPQNENTPFHPFRPLCRGKALWILDCQGVSRCLWHVLLFPAYCSTMRARGEGRPSSPARLLLPRPASRRGNREKLYLGNLSSLRDWGYARDYVECMWLILQQPKPDDYVIATGEQHSVREFCLLAFRRAGIELRFEGRGRR